MRGADLPSNRSLDKTLVVVLAGILSFSSCLALFPGTDSHDSPARVMQVGDPVAVISNLPVVVFNGTWALLNGSASYDPDGILVNFTWKVSVSTVPGEVITLYGRQEIFKFREAGIYTVNLTVRDNNGTSDSVVGSVWSFSDIDFDGLPDWWEDYYFESLQQNASDDPDGDGYSNLEEYGSGTDPTEKDPPPGLVSILKENWMYLAIIIAVVVVLAIVLWIQMGKRRKAGEKKLVEAAIEIERELKE